ncbi:MAG: hypothetical protein AB1704_39525 [Pseudomonadota bacterium]|uniref:hypothetical protein n=1 Tax=Burkholderiaceae TaxID=119060 RepID=UPI001BB1B77C|nr:hypothetical protein [Burkholderia sp. 4M9327F10]
MMVFLPYTGVFGFACGALILVVVLAVLAFPCFVFGLLALPLCGAALTFFAAAKKVSKESGLQPLARSEPSRSATGNGPRQDLPSLFPRS